MAVSTKTVSTVNVILQDSMNGDLTFKIDNPKSGITFGEIKSCFDSVINVSVGGDPNENLLCTKAGYDIVAVVGAEKVTIVTTKEPLA